MPSTRSVAVAALYVLSLLGTLMILTAAALDDDRIAITMMIMSAVIMTVTARVAALDHFRTRKDALRSRKESR